MSKMSKIDQIHLRAVMLCMSKMGKEHTHIFAHNFLNIQPIFNPQKVLESLDLGLSNHTIKSYVCQRCQRSNNPQHLQHSLTYIRVDGMVGKP